MATDDSYFKDGEINPALVDQCAREAAASFKKPPATDKHPNPKKINQSQLRKFYNEVKSLELRLASATEESKERAFLRILPLIKLLMAKSEYANKRDLVPYTFNDWIKKNISNISDRKTFEAFLLYFEAVVGFAYEKEK